jgi:hypothetical protein
MKVYVGYQCYYDYCNEWRDAVKIFSSQEKALKWQNEFKRTKCEWHAIEEFELE